MKKLLVALMILFSMGLQAQDVTGTWQSADGWKAEWFQVGNRVYAILNVYNFKQFISGTITGNQITGQVIRVDVQNNNCRTILNGTWVVNGNSMQCSWVAADGNCDLTLNQRGSDAPLTRVARPSELPMNTLNGDSFCTHNDVTGSWGDADWFQDGNNVYYISNNAGFKHFFSGYRANQQITGTQIRINRANNCRTEMGLTFTVTGSNSMHYRAVANDGNCDLQRTWSETNYVFRKSNIDISGVYFFKNKNSNLCLGVRGATRNNGEEATQWTCDGNEDKQWKLVATCGGYYKIQNMNSNLFLAVGAASRIDGGRVVQYVDQGQQDILWRFISIGNGCYKIQNKNSGLFLAIGAGSRDLGANLVQWQDSGQEDIKWILEGYIP